MTSLDSLLDAMNEDERFKVTRVLYAKRNGETRAVTIIFNWEGLGYTIWSDIEDNHAARARRRTPLTPTAIVPNPTLENVIAWINSLVEV